MSSAPTRRQRRFLDRYGPWAVVTGASSGIGRALAGCLAEAGLNLVLVARDRSRLETLAASLIASHGVQVQVVAVDLAREDQLAAIRRVTDPLEVGLLVASAGFGSAGPFLESDIASETEMLMVNGRAVLQACHHFGRRLRERGRGGLVLLSSIAAFQGMPYAAHYAATKAYVQSLAEALQVELRGDGVAVLAAAPGLTHSGFAARAGMRMGAALGRQTTVLPGALSKLLSWSLVPLPRWARVSIMGTVMRDMAIH